MRAVRFNFNFFGLNNQIAVGAPFSHLWEKAALAKQGSDEGSRADGILSGKRPSRMRFETLIFERYGAFTDRVLELREGAHLHVVFGANEAGKTSALNAIGDLLFGFPKIASYDFLHEKTTLRVGARLRLADGSTLYARRRRGNKNTLLDADDKPLPDDILAGALGSVTREVFVSEFGLTAEALRKGGQELLKAGGRLAETLAASSARLSMLANLRARLDAEAEDLFGARRAAGKEFYLALDQHQEAERDLRDAIVTADALKAAEAAVAEAQVKRRSLDEEHDRTGRDLARRERALRTAPKLRRLDSLRAELAGLADLPEVDAETLALWRAAHDEATSVERELADQRLDEAEGAAAIAELMVDEPLLEIGGKIDALREKLGAVRKAEDDLPRRGEFARIARAALGEAAARLGLASVEELLARQPSDPALARARELIGARREVERRLAEADDALTAAERELRELEQARAKRGLCPDPAPLLQRLHAFSDIPADADRLAGDAAELLERGRLAEEAARLDPSAGDIDALARLTLPDAADVESARQTFDALTDEEKRASAEAKAVRARLATIEDEIAALSRAGAALTRDDLARAGQARRGPCPPRRGADGEPSPARGFRGAWRRRARCRRRRRSAALGRRTLRAVEAARERKAAERRAVEKLAGALDELAARRRAAQAEWAGLWERAGVAPGAPRAMAAWLERVGDLSRRRARLAEQALDVTRWRKSWAGNARPDPADRGHRRRRDAALPIEASTNTPARASISCRPAGPRRAPESPCGTKRLTRWRGRRGARRVAQAASVSSPPGQTRSPAIRLGGRPDESPAQAQAALTVWRGVPLQNRL